MRASCGGRGICEAVGAPLPSGTRPAHCCAAPRGGGAVLGSSGGLASSLLRLIESATLLAHHAEAVRARPERCGQCKGGEQKRREENQGITKERSKRLFSSPWFGWRAGERAPAEQKGHHHACDHQEREPVARHRIIHRRRKHDRVAYHRFRDSMQM
jgi:hypothetical protein